MIPVLIDLGPSRSFEPLHQAGQHQQPIELVNLESDWKLIEVESQADSHFQIDFERIQDHRDRRSWAVGRDQGVGVGESIFPGDL